MMKQLFRAVKHTFCFSAVCAGLILGVNSAHAQVKVGNNPTTINGSAVLELESTNKGFLPTRVALTGTTDVTTIPSPANGLLVFNTATASDITPGIYYFLDGSWKKVETASSGSGSGGSGGNASVRSIAFVGPYTDQFENGVKMGDYSFRIRRRGDATGYTQSSENLDAQIKYSGPSATHQIAGYANTLYGDGQYDYTGTNLAAPSTNPTGGGRGNSLLNKDTWYGVGEVGFVTAVSEIEKRQYVITPADPAQKYFYRVEFMVIDPTPACPACNATTPSENDAKVIIYVEYLTSN